MGILGAAFRFRLERLSLVNNIMVLGTLLAVALFLVIGRRSDGPYKPIAWEMRVFLAGFVVWLLFVAVYVFVDLEKGVMRYAGAGHPPVLLVSAGEVRPMEENGLMLGLFPEAEYASAEIRVQTGDRCLLYTDGLYEAMNAVQEEFGKARLAHFLETHRGDSASRLAAALLEEIARWGGHSIGRRQEDDITLLVLDF